MPDTEKGKDKKPEGAAKEKPESSTAPAETKEQNKKTKGGNDTSEVMTSVATSAEPMRKRFEHPIVSTVPGATQHKTGPSAKEIFYDLRYGPAPEFDKSAHKWLKRFDYSFGLFINNKWVKREDRERKPIISPATGENFYDVTEATVEDVDAATESSLEAYQKWSKTTGHQRARVLYAIARHVQKNNRLIAVLEAMDNGKTIRETRDVDMPLTARHFYYHAGWAQLMETEMPDWTNVGGPIAQIVPLNFPLLMLAWKVAPALAMGATVIIKPAPLTPLSALIFSEMCVQAGCPPGVVNCITGGRVPSERLTTHPEIVKVDFCGSTFIGQTVRKATAGTGKSITLQMSGKSPIIVFEDADLDSAVEGIVQSIYRNQGQVCSAGSRLIVQESVAERFYAKIRRRIDTLRIGTSLDKCFDIGAVLAGTKRIERMVEMARKEGATIYQHPGPIPEKGDFYPPTLITDVEQTSTVVQNEIFGPVLACVTFRDPKEAVALANNTRYGLGGGVWSDNINLALETAFKIKSGICWVNCYNLMDAGMAFGGTRESGYGRQGGYEGLMNYVKPKFKKVPRPKIEPPITEETFEARWKEWYDHIFEIIPEAEDTPTEALLSVIDRTPKLYWGGMQKRPDGQYSKYVRGPDGKIVGSVGDGNRKDIRDSVEAARKAQCGWAKRQGQFNKSQIMYYMAELLEYRTEEFIKRIILMTGRSEESAREEVEATIQRLFTYAGWADKYGGTIQEPPLHGVGMSIREPVGVIAIVCPDEFPLLGFVSLFAPAIIRGNTIVIVPSEKHPLCATDFYQIFDTCDLPAGVVNIVTGCRNHLANLLALHQNVHHMWYFGDALGSYFVEYLSITNCKRTWCDYGYARNWIDRKQGEGHEFLHESVDYKNIWVPFGE